MKKGEQWVLKASMVNQAGAVHVFDDVAQLTAIITKQDDIREWVLQRYMYVISLPSCHCSQCYLYRPSLFAHGAYDYHA